MPSVYSSNNRNSVYLPRFCGTQIDLHTQTHASVYSSRTHAHACIQNAIMPVINTCSECKVCFIEYTVSIATAEWFMSNELEKKWKEAAVAWYKLFSRHLPVGTEEERGIVTELSVDSPNIRCLGRYSKPGPLKCKVGGWSFDSGFWFGVESFS